jgi:2-polyprenyl-3-methyl-5-hydroxy-6-metoxy-1,4-benzoquinol methylase
MNREKIEDIINSLKRDVAGTVNGTYLYFMQKRYAYLLEELSRTIPSGRVLDVGASPGLFTEMMRRAGYDAIGMDLFPHNNFHPVPELKKPICFWIWVSR